MLFGSPNATVGGTSLSAPLWQGMWARVQAAASATRFAAPLLYAHPDAFNDITFGDNGPYPATAGWDYTSGLGSPDVAKLITAIDGSTATVPPLTAALAPDAGTNDGGGGGGGGVATCQPGQDQIVGPPGDANQVFGVVNAGPSQQDLDILKANLSWSGDVLTATITVQNLTANPPDGMSNNEHFRYDFTYAGEQIELSADRGLSDPTTPAESFGVSVGGSTGTSGPADGSFRPETNTITITVTQAQLTTAGGPTLVSGNFLTGMSLLAQRDLGVDNTGATSTADDASASCDYQLP
jgi:hypothetical protein